MERLPRHLLLAGVVPVPRLLGLEPLHQRAWRRNGRNVMADGGDAIDEPERKGPPTPQRAWALTPREPGDMDNTEFVGTGARLAL